MLDPLELQVQLDRVAELLAQLAPQDLRELLERLEQESRGRQALRELRALLVPQAQLGRV